MSDEHCPVSLDAPAFAALNDSARTPAERVALAWHLRQRDTMRALALAEELRRELAGAGPDAADGGLLARLHLVKAEAAWLHDDMPGAQAAAEAAQRGFERLGDLPGQSDAWTLRAHVAFDGGLFDVARSHMRQSQAAAASAGDTNRSDGALGALAFWSLVDSTDLAEREWAPLASRLRRSADPRLAMWGHDFQGQLAAHRGQPSQAIAAFSEAFEHARRCGHVRRAIVACTNVAGGYGNLDDHASAIDWIQQGLDLARQAGWPASIGECLAMMGNALCTQQRFDAARRMLLEALALLSALPDSRELAVARYYLGDVAMSQGDFEGAAIEFRGLVTFGAAHGMTDLRCVGQCALAEALLRQGLRAQAAEAATAALALAEADGAARYGIEALLVLARASCPEPAPGQPEDYDPACLQRAMALAERVAGYDLPPTVWDAVARRHAAAGDFTRAHELAEKANALRDAREAQDAANRALALEARRETQRLRAEAETLSQRAAAEAMRARALQADNEVLEGLERLGSAITGQLTPAGIFEQLHHGLGALLDGEHVSLWMRADASASGPHLALVQGTECAQPMAPCRVPLTDTGSPLVSALLDDEEVLAGPWKSPSATWASVAAGPLRMRGRVAGVLCVGSRRPAAYGERERLVLRNACAWAAVALENAEAVRQLEAARQQLQNASEAELQARRQAEQATQLKGEFLAHISHDLRTPLASLHGYLETLLLRPGDAADADRARYLQAAVGQSFKVRRLAHELRDLAEIEIGAVQAVLQPVALAPLVHDVVQKLELAARARSQHVVERAGLRLPPALADPGLLERVLTNLLHNAIHHTPTRSCITVEVDVDVDGEVGGRLRVAVIDDGPGIPPELRASLFKRPLPVAQAHRPGGGGLGLLIVQRLLHQMGSEIRLVGRTGSGAAFEFSLPAAGPRARVRR